MESGLFVVVEDLVGLDDIPERYGALGTGPVGMVLLRQLAICVADAARVLLVPGNAENQIVVLHHQRAPSAGTARGDDATVGPGVHVRKTVSGVSERGSGAVPVSLAPGPEGAH